MIQDRHNVVPMTLAFLLHIVVFGSLIVVFDFSRSDQPVIPLAIRGTLVTDNAVVIPPEVKEPEPIPDTSEQERIAAEEQKRLEDKRVEQRRLEKIRQEQERQQLLAAEAERKRLAEEEAAKERRRVEAERRRQEEIERQRAENERLRREADDRARREELEAESARTAARAADARAAYMFRIQQSIARRWVRPASAEVGLECTVNVQQLPGGQVTNVRIGACNGDDTVKRSIENAVYQASPLPTPRDPSVFDRNLTLIFRPTD